MKFFDLKNWRTIVIILISLGLILLALSGYLSSLTDRIVTPVVKVLGWFEKRVQVVYEFFTIPRDVNTLRAENSELKNQVSQLQTEIIQLQSNLKESEILYALLGFARGRPEETYIAASVIGVDPSPFMKYILIDKGSDDGILFNMPVVTEKGLVGRITAVTASAARVQLISDPDSTVNAVIGDSKAECVVKGSITGDITVEMVSQDVQMRAGQVIQTSGLGGTYPSDIIIGMILNVNKLENEIFQSASIQPAEDFGTLQAVLVVANFRPSNITPLE